MLCHGNAAEQAGSHVGCDRQRRCGSTIPHVHTCREEFLILEGEAVEDDGTVLRRGDWIVYEAGARHKTRTVTGCLLLGLDWDPPG